MPLRRTVSFVFAAFVILAGTNAFAQVIDDETRARMEREAALAAAQQQEQARRTQEEMEKSQKALRDFLNDPTTYRRIPPNAQAGLKAGFFEFRMAIPKFREATGQYSQVLGVKDKREKVLKEIEAQTNVMIRYLALAKMKHPPADPQEFKDYSPTELEWEMLNSAERIAAFLDFAVQAEQQYVVDVKSLEFMFKLDGELLRLKWMMSHIK